MNEEERAADVALTVPGEQEAMQRLIIEYHDFLRAAVVRGMDPALRELADKIDGWRRNERPEREAKDERLLGCWDDDPQVQVRPQRDRCQWCASTRPAVSVKKTGRFVQDAQASQKCPPNEMSNVISAAVSRIRAYGVAKILWPDRDYVMV